MDSNGYSERLLVTDNTKKAAVLLTFGAQLRRHQPLTWINEFPSKDDYIAWRRHQNHKPKIKVSFNFEPDGVDVKAVLKAYDSEGAEDEFRYALEDTRLDPGMVTKLLALHSCAVAQGCREALEAREYLVKEHMQKFPESAKVNMVRGKGKTFAMFGMGASKETIVEHLSKIE